MAMSWPSAREPRTTLHGVGGDDSTAMEKGDDTQSDTASSHKDSRKDAMIEGQDAQLGQGNGEAVDEVTGV